jgi:hypothetical protein
MAEESCKTVLTPEFEELLRATGIAIVDDNLGQSQNKNGAQKNVDETGGNEVRSEGGVPSAPSKICRPWEEGGHEKASSDPARGGCVAVNNMPVSGGHNNTIPVVVGLEEDLRKEEIGERTNKFIARIRYYQHLMREECAAHRMFLSEQRTSITHKDVDDVRAVEKAVQGGIRSVDSIKTEYGPSAGGVFIARPVALKRRRPTAEGGTGI